MVVRIRRTGPVKKKMPLEISFIYKASYTTLTKEVAPPHPIKTIENVAVAIAKLKVRFKANDMLTP